MLKQFLKWRCATFHKTGWPVQGTVKCFSCFREWPVLQTGAAVCMTQADMKGRAEVIVARVDARQH